MKNTVITSYENLGTLGDKEESLTCSMHIAKTITESVIPCPTFEDAAQDVKKGHLNYLLVPGAFPRINSLIMDNNLQVVETFTKDIPSLVVAGILDPSEKEANIIYKHPATTDLLKEVDTPFKKVINVSSNSEACKSVLKDDDKTIAITNQICADYFGFKVYKILREAITMPWVIFTKKKG